MQRDASFSFYDVIRGPPDGREIFLRAVEGLVRKRIPWCLGPPPRDKALNFSENVSPVVPIVKPSSRRQRSRRVANDIKEGPSGYRKC